MFFDDPDAHTAKYAALINILAPISLFGITLYVYRFILSFWWLGDDPMVLKHAAEYAPWEYFFVPQAWLDFGMVNLTPWSTFTMDMDLWAFGLSPAPFYAHHLIAAAMAAVCVYLALSRYFHKAAAYMGALILVFSPPFLDICENLFKRHYLEGLVFVALSFIFQHKAMKKGSFSLSCLSAFFYLLSVTAKEIYVPYVLISFLLILKSLDYKWNLQAFLRLFFPFFAISLFYVGWRRYMLKSFFGGYGACAINSFDDVARIGHTVLEKLHFNGFVITILLLIFLIAAIYVFFRIGLEHKFLWAGAVFIAIFPIVPVLCMFSVHYMLFPYVVLSFALTGVAHYLFFRNGNKAAKAMGCAALLVIAFYNANCLQNDAIPSDTMDRIEKEGVFMLEKGRDNDIIAHPLMPFWHHQGLRWLRGHFLKKQEGPGITNDLCFLEKDVRDGIIPEPTIQTYDAAAHQLMKVSMPLDCDTKDDAPLWADVEYLGSFRYNWRLGPYDKGAYAFVLPERPIYVEWPVNREGMIKARIGNGMAHLVVRYISPEGWRTYSEPLTIDLTKGPMRIEWQR